MSPETRHRVMASIRKTDTRPELAFRAALREAGLTGYRKHAKNLIGRPDVAFTRWRVAIFVDGVWWHGHPDYFKFGSRGPYWDKKIAGNIARDKTVTQHLTEGGWLVLRFWDMEVLHEPARVIASVRRALAERGRMQHASHSVV